MKKYLIENPTDVLDALYRIIKKRKIAKGDLIASLQKAISTARLQVLLDEKGNINWKQWFINTGSFVYNILMDYKFDEISFAKFLLHKHRLYGLEPLLGWQEIGILMRLDSKVARLTNITNNKLGIDLGDETVEDTLKDALGYCILGMLLCEKKNYILTEESD